MTETLDASVLYETGSGYVSGPGESMLIAGIAKLAQKVLLELLTSAGSVKYNSSVGSPFLHDLSTRNIYSEYDIYISFAMASLAVKRNIKNDETDDTPTSEKIHDIKLVRVAVLPDTLLLTITVTNKDNNQTNLTVGVEVAAR